jgi:hypothetical protein
MGAPFRPVPDVSALRASGVYRVMTPDECITAARQLGHDSKIEFHPLVGGLDPALGWASLRLFEHEVMPVLVDDGLVTRR